MADGLRINSKKIQLVDRKRYERSFDSGFIDDDDRGTPNGEVAAREETPLSSCESLSQKIWRLPRAATDIISKESFGPTVLQRKVKSAKPASKPIINDLDSGPIKRESVTMHKYAISPDSLSLDGDTQLERTPSFESLASGVSCGTTASEERLGILQYVRSFSSLSSRDTKSAVGNQSVYSEPANFKAHERFTKSGTCLVTPSRNHVEFDETAQGDKEDSESTRKRHLLHRMTSNNYDSDLEKSQTYLHGRGKHFSKTNQYLTPTRPGLSKLQICYTTTNTENNHLVIFADLIRTSHRKNRIIDETVHNLERRLQIRRSDPNRATTYYVNKGMKDPIRTAKKKSSRSIASKKKERLDRIKKTTEEMKMGYVPTSQTVKTPSREEVELLRGCRYLRIDPKLQDFSIDVRTNTFKR
ncbi:hypothetical protein FSP39_014838 [Pinctada imbricata]|uniref:Uncharacterized protein n=1 Tax=Pinctada imbricata TaxID=66713 RepID=A0AA89BS24_PINIB|nr:hypothetical protein FSP39_014838 [Pinctada imbricata]